MCPFQRAGAAAIAPHVQDGDLTVPLPWGRLEGPRSNPAGNSAWSAPGSKLKRDAHIDRLPSVHLASECPGSGGPRPRLQALPGDTREGAMVGAFEGVATAESSSEILEGRLEGPASRVQGRWDFIRQLNPE